MASQSTSAELVGAPPLSASSVPALQTRPAGAEPQAAAIPGEQFSRQASRAWEWFLGAVIAIGLPLLLYLTFRDNLLHPLVRDAELHDWQRLILRPSILWAFVGALLLMFRTVMWFFYRPFPSATFEEAPPLTVIIPAYNEGAMVRKSIDSVAASRYPRERLEIIAIDDGSTDDTWKYIQEAAERHGELVKALRQPRNQGKRAALARGFREARGEVMVTLDSDSVVERDALLAIAGPFRDKRVGAVAGKVVAYNRHEGIIPRMLHVRFTVSFDLLRAAESSYGNVFCCPGALTAYRASAVRRMVKRWLNQKFLGSNCTIGEDRAMTNMILGAGYNTVYQGSAVVHTVVPVTYMKVCKMFLRWDRSYVREEVKFMQLVHKRPWRSRAIAFVDRVVTNTRYPFHYLSLILLASLIPGHPWVLVRLLLAVGLFSLLNTLYFLRSERSFDIVYGVLFSYFELFAMFWVFPYAVCTVRSRGWLTR